MFSLVVCRENKLKKDQDSELPDYHIRWVLGFYDMKKNLLEKFSCPLHPRKDMFGPYFRKI